MTLLVVLASPASSRASDGPDARPSAPTSVASRPSALRLWAISARSDSQRATSRRPGRALFRNVVVGSLSRRASLRVASSHHGPLPVTDPELTLGFDLVRGRRHGLTLVGGYQAEAMHRTPVVVAGVTIARTFGDTKLVTTALLGRGTRDEERHGDLRGSVLREYGRGWLVGIDARARVDLERDGDEPVGETDWEVFAGPLFARSIGPLVWSATAGVFATKLRLVPRRRFGAEAMMAIGVPF